MYIFPYKSTCSSNIICDTIRIHAVMWQIISHTTILWCISSKYLQYTWNIFQYSGCIINHMFDFNHLLLWNLYKKVHFNLNNFQRKICFYVSYQILIINRTSYKYIINSTLIQNPICNVWYEKQWYWLWYFKFKYTDPLRHRLMKDKHRKSAWYLRESPMMGLRLRKLFLSDISR